MSQHVEDCSEKAVSVLWKEREEFSNLWALHMNLIHLLYRMAWVERDHLVPPQVLWADLPATKSDTTELLYLPNIQIV